jgi:phenylacetate-CoA ligase
MLQRSEDWTPSEIAQYQYDRLCSLLRHCERSVPWYGRLFAEYGISSRDLVNLEDIRRFPTTSKEDIRDHLEDFVSSEMSRRSLIYATTGGSTAIPCGFYQTQSIRNIEKAFFSYHWGWFGCGKNDVSVVLRGEFVGSERDLIRYSPSRNEWHFSTYFLTRDNLPFYVDMLNRIKPVFIQAYPSAIDIFAQYLLENGHQIDCSIKAVMCGSENIYDPQIVRIEEAFKTHVHAWYGQAEKVCLAVWSKTSRMYHAFPQYGYTEVLDHVGTEVREEGHVGEIVATGFSNYAMPLIRYRTSDFAVHTNAPSPDGLLYRRFDRIEGRLQELFVTGNGRLVSMTAINMHDDIFDNVRQFQFFQDMPGVLIMRVIPKGSYSDADRSRIEERLRSKIGRDTMMRIEIVDEIPRTTNGKLRFLIQKLPITSWGEMDVVR